MQNMVLHLPDCTACSSEILEH